MYVTIVQGCSSTYRGTNTSQSASAGCVICRKNAATSALAADPRNVDKIIALGVAQSGARQFREAIQTFTRGLAIAPNNALLYRWRGHRYLSVRELDKAMDDLTTGARIDSTVYGIWYH